MIDVHRPSPKPTASGFDFEPLPDGNVLIEFFGDDGHTINEQIVTAEVVRRMPVVAALMDAAVRMGPEVAREIRERFDILDRSEWKWS